MHIREQTRDSFWGIHKGADIHIDRDDEARTASSTSPCAPGMVDRARPGWWPSL
jgi:hypothetical protein